MTNLEKARKRLKAAEAATALFTVKIKGRELCSEDVMELERLLAAELNASILLSDLKYREKGARATKS